MSETAPSLDRAHQAAAMRLEFRRRHFSEREHLLLSWILDFSLVCGRDDMTAPTLESLGQLCHLSRGNVHGVIHSLELMHVLQVESKGDVRRYRINSDLDGWHCRPRLSREELRFALATLREANGYDTDFFERHRETPENFPALSLDRIFAAPVPESKTVPPHEP